MASADNQHASTGHLTPSRDRAAERLRFLDESVGQFRDRTFRVRDGVLEERVQVRGRTTWVNATTSANPNGAVQQLYFADGRLYDRSGRCLGTFGIDSKAGRSLAGRSFLHTFGTLQTPGGALQDYSGMTLSLNGRSTVIVLGPPPGTRAILRSSTRNVLVDSRCGRYFHELSGDRAYERIWVPESSRRTTEAPRVSAAAVRAIRPRSDGWRYSTDGRMRFRVLNSGEIRSEARLHLATNWRGGGALSSARVGWVDSPDLVAGDGPPPGPAKRQGPEKLPLPSEDQTPKKQPVIVKQPAPPAPKVEKKAPEKVTVVVPPLEKRVELPRQVQVTTDMHADAIFHLFVVSRQLKDIRGDVGRGRLPAIPQPFRLTVTQFLTDPEGVCSRIGMELPRDTMMEFRRVWRLNAPGGPAPGGLGVPVKMPAQQRFAWLRPGGPLNGGPQDGSDVVTQLLNVETFVSSSAEGPIRNLRMNRGAEVQYFTAVRNLILPAEQRATSEYESMIRSYLDPRTRQNILQRLRRLYENRPVPFGMPPDYWANAIDELELDLTERHAQATRRPKPVRRPPVYEEP